VRVRVSESGRERERGGDGERDGERVFRLVCSSWFIGSHAGCRPPALFSLPGPGETDTSRPTARAQVESHPLVCGVGLLSERAGSVVGRGQKRVINRVIKTEDREGGGVPLLSDFSRREQVTGGEVTAR
jgi:hypothetical protein